MITLNLNTVEFSRAEALLVQADGIKVFAFRYASGVAALRVCNQVGEIIFLPFHGQQIWNCHFHGRRLTMRSMFDEPVNTRHYLKNYGAFLLHCGATAMGNPGPSDSHDLHGELPNASYQEASINLGADEDGTFVELTGRYRHTVAFAHNYVAEPTLRIHAKHAKLQLDLKVHNLKHDAMELMYLAHVNFKPVNNARLVDTVPDDPHNFNVRDKIPEFFKPNAEHTALIAAVKQDPTVHRLMRSGKPIDPELVMGLKFKSDESGWAHSMQVLPDGTSDFISHKPAQLRHGVRWITRTANQDALGLFLPGTAEADGFTVEKAKGNLVTVGAGASFACVLKFGALTDAETSLMQDVCLKTLKH
jgi:Domain of unknown function (DUF4432)